MGDKFYFSKEVLEDCIWEGSSHLKLLFIPNKWWSLSAWKMAIDFKKNFTIYGMIKDKDNQ